MLGSVDPTHYLASLTPEQRALLDEFEFRAIETADTTPTLVVSASLEAQQDGRGDHSGRGKSEAASDTADPHGDDDNAELLSCPGVPSTSTLLDERREGNDADPLNCAEKSSGFEQRAMRYVEASTSDDDADGDVPAHSQLDGVAAELIRTQLDRAAPLLHSDLPSADRECGGRGLVEGRGDGALPLPVGFAMNDGEGEGTLEERCLALAERLVDSSAEAQGVGARLDHRVPPPSEFF